MTRTAPDDATGVFLSYPLTFGQVMPILVVEHNTVYRQLDLDATRDSGGLAVKRVLNLDHAIHHGMTPVTNIAVAPPPAPGWHIKAPVDGSPTGGLYDPTGAAGLEPLPPANSPTWCDMTRAYGGRAAVFFIYDVDINANFGPDLPVLIGLAALGGRAAGGLVDVTPIKGGPQ